MVIGVGDGLDVPIEALTQLFPRITLADVVISPTISHLSRRFGDQIHPLLWDATGALEPLAKSGKTLSPDQLVEAFSSATPRQIPDPTPDCIISANCLSQLGLIPASSLGADKGDEELENRCMAAAAQVHLTWLRSQTANVILIGDRARLDKSRTGEVLWREAVLPELNLREPDATWEWCIAPAPEHHPDHDRVHEVGAWLSPF